MVMQKPLPSPNLDDRSFNQLVAEARQHIQETCPAWTDLTPGDPGMVLLELFAHLTETMLYRLNRLPEKAYIEFLNLIGVKLQPPAAAGARLRFSRTSEVSDQPVEIPRGTRVTIRRAEGGQSAPIFITSQTATIPQGEHTVEVLAYHAKAVDAELAGYGSGLPGQVIDAGRPPIIAQTQDGLSLVVGIETPEDEVRQQEPVFQHDGKIYRVWREVDNFTDPDPDDRVYIADRRSGAIIFAPAARTRTPEGDLIETPRTLAAVPPARREIRLWYRRGGGPEGNVAAHTLTVLKDPIHGVEVTNPGPATGGQAGESLKNALVRGPQELHALNRAVTARDFELLALSSSRVVARVRTLTRAALWAHATAGAVEVLLVPTMPATTRKITAAMMAEQETETARERVVDVLDQRRPLGTALTVSWAHYKTVKVAARIVVRRYEDQGAVRDRVIKRLYDVITPLPTDRSPTGWPFGQALRASHIYDIALAEPGVLWVDQVRLHVDAVPAHDVRTLTNDAFQSSTWYAGSGETLYRSTNDGEGWEPVGTFPGEGIEVVRSHPERAGLLAVVSHRGENGSATIRISYDCGESWIETVYTTAFEINDVAWVLRDGAPVLFLATNAGLYDLTPRPGGSPVQVLVEPQDQDLGFYAVAATMDARGETSVAVAAQGTRGVYLSTTGGQPNSFRRIGLEGEDVRVLAVQISGPRSFLWAGPAAAGGDPGKGCFRWELRGAEDPPEGWQLYGRAWAGGSCRDLAFQDGRVLAGTHRAGVQILDAGQRDPTWQASNVRCGLPLRDPGRFHPVDAVAAGRNTTPAGQDETLIMAAGREGVYLSRDGGQTYASISERDFNDKVTLPPTWLFCSGDHEIEVVSEDEAERD